MNCRGPARYLSPSCRPASRSAVCESLSSSSCSSCSSLSAASLHWDRSPRPPASDDDCTLNEMMGKYDESYVYEKETDILSDSDPTDCDTDIDTGQDGGDEDDALDFIDQGSLLDLAADRPSNTGHCTYFAFEHRKSSQPRRRPTRRSSHAKSAKKRHRQDAFRLHSVEGTKSAGATPLSVRRIKQHPLSKLVSEKRSNSVSFSRDPVSAFDQRDKEADRKYKELIVEAEHILMSMKTNVQSPRRLPGPANKRVEILRSAESSKPDAFVKSRLAEDISVASLHVSRHVPSIPRFSPKRNHITNFINNNSPVLVRRDVLASPLLSRKEALKTPLMLRKKHAAGKGEKRSPKYRKKLHKNAGQKRSGSCSSDSETERKSFGSSRGQEFNCPQSEPVKRKIYASEAVKAVAFNLNHDSLCTAGEFIAIYGTVFIDFL